MKNRPSASVPIARVALLQLSALFIASVATAAGGPAVRLTSVGKDRAVLAVDLPSPATISVSFGEEPFAWTGTIDSAGASAQHEVVLEPLVPDRRYFYQLSFDGIPGDEILTFRAGRSWVTRRAVILATADAAGGRPGEEQLANRLFADESDLLVVLDTPAGHDPDLFAALHARTLADRVVIALGAGTPDAATTLSDVALTAVPEDDVRDSGSRLELDRARFALAGPSSACWRVLAVTPSAEPLSDSELKRAAEIARADVTLARGVRSSLEIDGERLLVRLADPDAGGQGTRDHVRLSFAAGALEASLLADGVVLASQALQRSCPIPGLATSHADESDGDGDFGEAGTSDAGDLGSDQCDEW